MTVLLPDEHPPAADAPLDGSPSSSCQDITNTLSVSPPFDSGAAPSASPRVVMAYRLLVGLLGAIWLANGWFQFSAWVLRAGPAHPAPLLDVLNGAAGLAPAWLRPWSLRFVHLVHAIGPQTMAIAMVAVALLLGLAMIFRRGLDVAGWVGLAYSLFCWVALCALGFPYTGGQTDPGVFPAYAIAFLFVLAVAPVIAPSGSARARPRSWAWRAGAMLFALLWVFDAVLKWSPYFLGHFLSQLTPAIQGQPSWVVTYIGWTIAAVRAIGPTPVAVTVAVAETALAFSLLSGVLVSLAIPLGFLYSLAVWTTAEGFGGPYGPGGTGVRGDVLGNVLIYALVFLFLAAGRRRAGRR
jgi:hypothetical protein